MNIFILSLYMVTNMTEEDTAKQYVIEAVFYDAEYINTLKHARQINKNITMDDTNRFINREFHLEKMI